MFGWFRRKAAEVHQARAEAVSMASDEAARFMLSVQAALGGFPRTLLDDPFIIGAASTYAAITLKVSTNGQATNALIEASMVDAVEKAFFGKNVARHEAYGALMKFKNNPEYAKAVQVVSLILGARFGRSDLIQDPLVVEARQRVASMPKAFRKEFGATEEEQVAHELSRRHFIQPLKEKYGELWRNPGDA